MDIYYIVIIGIALAMDAFGVSVGIGLNPILKRRNKIKFILFLEGQQDTFLMYISQIFQV